MTLLAIWMLYTFLAVAFFSLIFLWAVRTRQFSDQERVSRLPLADAEAPPGPPPTESRHAWLAVLGVPLAILVLGGLVLVGVAIYAFTH
ncbi:MAG TPA: cbb3-type cytochrome oxidase assembly protein CcoS [Armatimonadota bacterium]|jgi:cbb3-type cytochrome oxidase maturation protein